MGMMDGKTVIVTGGAGGIGRAVCQLLASRGARIVVADTGVMRDGSPGDPTLPAQFAAELRTAGAEAVACEDSVSTKDGAAAIIDMAVRTFGGVDSLVCAAGVLCDRTILKLDAATLDANLDVLVKGTLYTAQAFVSQVLKQEDHSEAVARGRIVAMTSATGLLGAFGQAAMSAANSAVYGLCRTLAIELQRHRIFVNCVAPLAKTRLTEELPLFRGVATLTPAHVAPAVVCLASDLAQDRTGALLGAAGARMYSIKLAETPGRFKDADDGVWSPEEIAEHWDRITKA